MNLFKKNILCAFAVGIILLTNSLKCVDSITITAPAPSSTVTGMPLAISGTSSQANKDVRVSINTTEIAIVTTAGDGTWSFSLDDLFDGNYTITATLISDSFEILATDSNNFTVDNSPTIYIEVPEEGEFILSNPALAFGASSEVSATVQLLVDDVVVNTTTTDSQGNWQASYTVPSNGSHTLKAQLMSGINVLAEAQKTISAQVPVIFPSGTTQATLVSGIVPTTGSGSGAGYNFSVTGSAISLTFDPAFTSPPTVVTTGLFDSGSSTASLSSVSTTSASIAFSAGTQSVHFIALLLS